MARCVWVHLTEVAGKSGTWRWEDIAIKSRRLPCMFVLLLTIAQHKHQLHSNCT